MPVDLDFNSNNKHDNGAFDDTCHMTILLDTVALIFHIIHLSFQIIKLPSTVCVCVTLSCIMFVKSCRVTRFCFFECHCCFNVALVFRLFPDSRSRKRERCLFSLRQIARCNESLPEKRKNKITAEIQIMNGRGSRVDL